MGEIEEVLAQVEVIAREIVPSCFEVRSVTLAPADEPVLVSPFAAVVRVVRWNDEPDPGGWAYDLANRLRERWHRDDFQISIREDAYRAGVPGNGEPFPDGSKIAKIEWKLKKSTEAPFYVRVPDTLQDMFLIEKDLKRFPNTKGWAYAVFDYNPASDSFAPNATGVVNCGFACHTRVAKKDYIFTAYGKR